MSDRILELLQDPDTPPLAIDRDAVVAGGRRRARHRQLAQATGVGAGVAALALTYAVLPRPGAGTPASAASASPGALASASPGALASAPHRAAGSAPPAGTSAVTAGAGCPVRGTLTADRPWDLGDGRSARLRVLITECGVSARLASPGLGGYVVGALPDQPVQDGLPAAAFDGVLPLADRDGGGFGSLPIAVAPRDELPAGAEDVVGLGHGWAASTGTLLGAAGKSPSFAGSSPPALPGHVVGTAGAEVDYPDITSTRVFPFTVDGQQVNVTVSVGTAEVAPGELDHIVVNPAGMEPDRVELGRSIAVFTPGKRGPAVWAAQSAPAGTTAPWAILGVASSGIDQLLVGAGSDKEVVAARPLGDTGYVIYLTSRRAPLTDSVQPPVLTPLR